MAKSVLSDLRFHNEQAAFDYVEKQLWPNGPTCPHCQATGDKIGRLNGKTTRAGLHKCYACRKPFTVRINSIFEDSHLPLRLWLQAIHLMCASKKGISTRQLQRTLGCGLKTAWHLGHRIRFAMAPDASSGPLGGAGKIVEADETALTNPRKTKRPPGRKRPHAIVLSLVERGGNTRSSPWTIAASRSTCAGLFTKIAVSFPMARATTNCRRLRRMKAWTIPSMSGRATMFM